MTVTGKTGFKDFETFDQKEGQKVMITNLGLFTLKQVDYVIDSGLMQTSQFSKKNHVITYNLQRQNYQILGIR